MTRTTRFIAIAIAATAFAPVARAAEFPYPFPADDPASYRVVVDDLPAVWPPEEPGATAADWPAEAPAFPGIVATAQPAQRKPSVAKQQGFWGIAAPSLTLITDNSPSQNRISLRNIRAIAAQHAKQKKASVPLITENSPSQNRVAPRKVAPTRTLVATLWTSPR